MSQRPLCTSEVGTNWVDSGTTACTRHAAPAHRHHEHHHKPHATAPHLTTRDQQVLAMLTAVGKTDWHERAMFLAQMSHESNDFQRLRENLHYKAKHLLETFHHKRHGEYVVKDLKDAEALVQGGTDAIAERIYGGREDLGNTHPGDGAKYIGRGIVQLTGRSNYAAAGAALNLDLVNHPELAETFPVAMRIALWFWAKHKIGPPARQDHVVAVTRKINGGVVGLADRRKRYQKYLMLLRRAHPAPHRDVEPQVIHRLL